MLHSIVDWINESLTGIIPGAKLYGIARTAAKDEKLLPVTEKGDWIYAGIDDTYKFQSYHKHLTISSANVPNSGYGDNLSSLSNTYGMALIVFIDEKKTGIKADELYTIIQASITGILKIEGYKSVRVSVTNAILNDGQVWTQEYGNTPLRLTISQRLIQIGYSVVTTLDKNCIKITKCKN